MDFELLQKVIAELSYLRDASVDRVYEDIAKNIILVLRKKGRNFFLLISPDRALPRVHLVQQKPPAAISLHPFTLFLKSRASGGRIIAMDLLNNDRIASVLFVRQGTEHELIIELMGRNTNLILCDASRAVLSVYHPAPLSEASSRMLLPGILYQLPKQREHKQLPAEQVTSDQSGMFWNSKAEQHSQAILDQRRFSAARETLASVIRKALKKAERLHQNLTQDRSWTETAETYRVSGDLILANLGLLHTGMSSAELTGYDGTRRIIALDPVRSPKKNAELCFKKYKKAKAGRTIIEIRLRESEKDLHYLQSLLQDLENTGDEQDLQKVHSMLEKKGYIRRATARKGSQSAPPENMSVRKIFYQGWEIVVGKNASGNDHLTTKIAAPDDLWLHAEGLPGSHVLVRNPDKKELPEGVLLKAASLAAYYSKGRGAGKVSVTYTLARHVKKPKGAKAGLVMLSERKSILAAPAQE